MPTKNKTKQGVVILFAVLLVTVVLTISLGIFNITYRQLVLSSIARESEIAFFAADSARNCALYWDSPLRDKNTENPFGFYEPVAGGTWNLKLGTTDSLACGGESIPVEDLSNPSAGYSGRTFKLFFTMAKRTACAEVTVEKKNTAGSSDRRTIITANGYNIIDTDPAKPEAERCPPTSINRAVERTIVAETEG